MRRGSRGLPLRNRRRPWSRSSTLRDRRWPWVAAMLRVTAMRRGSRGSPLCNRRRPWSRSSTLCNRRWPWVAATRRVTAMRRGSRGLPLCNRRRPWSRSSTLCSRRRRGSRWAALVLGCCVGVVVVGVAATLRGCGAGGSDGDGAVEFVLLPPTLLLVWRSYLALGRR